MRALSCGPLAFEDYHEDSGVSLRLLNQIIVKITVTSSDLKVHAGIRKNQKDQITRKIP